MPWSSIASGWKVESITFSVEAVQFANIAHDALLDLLLRRHIGGLLLNKGPYERSLLLS